MSGKKVFSLILFLTLLATLGGCGDSSSKNSNVVDAHRPTSGSIQVGQPNNSPQRVSATFSPRSHDLISGSDILLGRVNKGYSVQLLNEEQKAKIREIFHLTNQYRREHGLPPLQYDARLGAYAYVRTDEIRYKYAHERPNSGKKHSGLTLGKGWKGENLDVSQESAAATFNRWVESETHREALLEPHFTRIGIGYLYDPNSLYKYHWSQIFASGTASTPYHFDARMVENSAPPMERHLSQKVALHDGKISLLGGQKSRRDNTAINYQRGHLTHGIYKSARHYPHSGYDAIVQEPAGVFSYQTFGEVVDPSREPIQYLNIGQPTVPEEKANFHATYRGAAVGNFNRHSHVYADVSAQVNFGQTKSMTVQFNNSRIARNDITANNPAQALSRISQLDFTENLQWNANQGRFNGDTTTANFYGPHGEEIGGQFVRQFDNGIYQGAFGLQKVD